jgi:hypothetical protein
MKFNPTLFLKKPERSFLFISMLYVAICFSSCKHDDDIQIPDQAAFSITNASPTKTSVDFFIDNKRVNNSGGLPFGNNTGYWLALTGSRTATVTAAGSSTNLHTGKVTLETGRYYSVFIVNSADTLSLLNINDRFLDVVPEGKAQIRFINLSPDAPAYNLEYEGDTTAFTNRAYKDYTAFKNVPAKTGITLNLKNAATNAVVATLPNIELKNRQTYTIWAKGLSVTASPDTTQKLSLKITRLVQNF